MIKIVQKLLRQLDRDIDAGNTNVSEDDCVEILQLLKRYVDSNEPMSKYQAYTYLNISRATFDNYVKEGKLPEGKKVAGFKELFWYKRDLDKYIKTK